MFLTLAAPTSVWIELPNLISFTVHKIDALDAVGFIRVDSPIDTLHRTLFIKDDGTWLFEPAASFLEDWRRDVIGEFTLDRANLLLAIDLFESHRGEIGFLGGFLELLFRRPMEVHHLGRHLFTPEWKFL